MAVKAPTLVSLNLSKYQEEVIAAIEKVSWEKLNEMNQNRQKIKHARKNIVISDQSTFMKTDVGSGDISPILASIIKVGIHQDTRIIIKIENTNGIKNTVVSDCTNSPAEDRISAASWIRPHRSKLQSKNIPAKTHNTMAAIFHFLA